MALPRDLDLSSIDPSSLSGRARETLRTVVWPLAEGVSIDEVAASLGTTRRQVTRLVDDLRAELLERGVHVPLPAHTDDERRALSDSIAELGVVAPIIVDAKTGEVVDGHARKALAARAGVPCPAHPVSVRNPGHRRELELALNLARRHVSRAQRRLLIESELARDPSRSDRRIAAICGVDHKTVAAARRRLEERGDVGRIPTRRDVLGREQPATRTPRPAGDGEGRAVGAVEVTLVLSLEEHEAWMSAAHAAGVELADWLRSVANAAVAEAVRQ